VKNTDQRRPGKSKHTFQVVGRKELAVECPRVCTGEGAEVQLDSYARLQPDGRRQRAVREGIVAGLTSWPLRLPDGSGVRTPRGPATQDKHHRRFRPAPGRRESSLAASPRPVLTARRIK